MKNANGAWNWLDGRPYHNNIYGNDSQEIEIV